MKRDSYKIAIFIAFTIISFVAILITSNYILKKENELLSKKYDSITNNVQNKIKSIINKKKNATLALTITLSSNKNVLDILTHKKVDIELNKLSLLLRDETAFKNVWFQVLDSKGISLYRSWSKKRNDKLYKIRPDLNEMIENPKIRSTISVGKYDMTFKAMVPIYENNKFIGIIESITHFNSISKGLRISNNIEPIIIVEKEFTEQLKENAFTGIFVKEHYVANLSVNKKILKYIEKHDISELLNIEEFIIKDDYLIINTPIIYKDKKLASFLSLKKIKDIDLDYIQEYKQNTFLYLALFIILLGLLIFVISYYLYSKELRKLYNKLNKNQKELHDLNKSLKQTVDNEVEKNYKKNKLLFQQSKMAAMGEMIGNIAHQWRQPLSLITSAASGIKLKKELNILEDKEHRESLDAIIQSANHLSSTIDDFRYFFSPNKNRTTLYSTELFQKIFKLLESEFKSKNIQVIQNIDKLELCTYENELIQVIINILNNAKDELLKIEDYDNRYIFIDLYEEDGNMIIKIKDNAGGISESIIDRIFEPYFTTKHKSQGTGIGLYMSEEIISKHLEGRLSVSNYEKNIEGRKDIGAEFLILLPLDKED
jgi:signal transduction histidine kinase